MTEAEDSLPTQLRAHIKAEKLRPDLQSFSRSIFLLSWSAIVPFLFIAFVVLLARSQLIHEFLLVIISLPLFLASQRCFQTLVHDLSHKLFSVNTSRNDLLGNFLVAGWSGASVSAYRAIHLHHHKYNGSALDPEHISFELIRQRGGLLRHCLRYILGFEVFRLVNKYYGKKKTENSQSPTGSKSLKNSKLHIFICQIVLAAILIFIAHAWYLYLIWLYLAVTWNPLLSNLRFLVEHPGESDLTVSTTSNWLGCLYFAPFNFNYHLEHHLWPNLPPYRLQKAHQYLQSNGYFERHPEFLGTGFLHSLRNRN